MIGALASGLCGLGLFLTLTAGAWAEPSPAPASAAATPSTLSPRGDLAAHLSEGATAMEYWDVTAWLESGDRFFARFLVTNQGPGKRTAAAVGHLVLPQGAIVPFKWGRRSDAWTLADGGRKLTIAKAVLDVAGPTIAVEVDSKKQGIKLRLEIARAGPPVATPPLPGSYAVDVVMPAPAHGRLWARGISVARAVAGTAVVTHAWMERPEADVLRRRIESFTRVGEVALYVSDVTLADGARRSIAVASRGTQVRVLADDVAVNFDGTTTADGDPRYPVPARWDVRGAALAAVVDVRRELLRWDPLEILPQPFRLLMALGGRPQRVWSEAMVDLTVEWPNDGTSFRAQAGGIIAASFARPLPPAD